MEELEAETSPMEGLEGLEDIMIEVESLLGIVNYLRAGTNKLASPNHVIRRECSHSNTPTHERSDCGENKSNRNRQLELILKNSSDFVFLK